MLIRQIFFVPSNMEQKHRPFMFKLRACKESCWRHILNQGNVSAAPFNALFHKISDKCDIEVNGTPFVTSYNCYA